MKKVLLSAALVASLCVPAYAAQFTNDDSTRYDAPVFEDEQQEDAVNETVQPRHKHETKSKKDKKADKEEAATQALPIHLTAEHAEYDSTSGDFHASGSVVITQGAEKLLTTYAVGNMKTGDVWLEKGGTLKEPTSKMNGQWAHYNFNTKTGEIKEIDGVSMKDIFKAPHATIYPDKIVVDQGGTTARCPAVKHPPCLSIDAETFEIYPKEKMVAHNVKVYVRGVHVYSRDLWINDFNDDGKTKIMPRIGYDGKENGSYVKLELAQPIDEKTMVSADMPYYSKAGFRPNYGIRRNERNFTVSYSTGWDEDDNNWYKKQNNWKFNYKNHHIVDGLPLSYSAYAEYGLWSREYRNGGRGPKSWHKEYGVYLNHDPIYLFGSKNTVLNLTTGKKWVNESYTGNTTSTELFYATLGQKLSRKWRTWAGYYGEHQTSSMFDIGQPDMAKELRNGLQYAASDRDVFSIVNRFDLGKGKQYETDYRWLHKFCCWAVDLTYEREKQTKDNTFKIHYYFYNL